MLGLPRQPRQCVWRALRRRHLRQLPVDTLRCVSGLRPLLLRSMHAVHLLMLCVACAAPLKTTWLPHLTLPSPCTTPRLQARTCTRCGRTPTGSAPPAARSATARVCVWRDGEAGRGGQLDVAACWVARLAASSPVPFPTKQSSPAPPLLRSQQLRAQQEWVGAHQPAHLRGRVSGLRVGEGARGRPSDALCCGGGCGLLRWHVSTDARQICCCMQWPAFESSTL